MSASSGSSSTRPTRRTRSRTVVAVAARKAQELGLGTLSCSSTGNLAGAVAARAAAEGLKAAVFVPADLEPEKLAAAAAYGPTIYAVDGHYDHCSRLSVELSFELPLGLRQRQPPLVLRRGLEDAGVRAGGAARLAPAGRRRDPDRVGSALPQGRPGLCRARASGWSTGRCRVSSAVRRRASQPVATAFRERKPVTPVRPDSIARSLAIGNPADGDFAVATVARDGRRDPRGRRGRGRREHGPACAHDGCLRRDGERRDARRARAAVEAGEAGADDRVVLLVTGDGLKTLGPVAFTYAPVHISADADAFLDGVLEAA